jgi:membrane-associated phospholipid phosphatase
MICIAVIGVAAQTTPPLPLSSIQPAPTPSPVSTPAPTPTPSTKSAPSLERQFLRNILRDQRAIWTSPLHLQADDAKWLVPLGLSTAALIATDHTTARKIFEYDDHLAVSHSMSQGGNYIVTTGFVTTFYLVGRKFKNRRARETGILGAQALIDGLIVTQTIKVATQRPQPLSDRQRGRFFTRGLDFPSGHAAAAWSLAAIVANEYRDKRYVGVAAYSIATAVSVARYTARRHFLSDSLVGSFIGYGIGRYVYRTHHVVNRDSNDEEDEIDEPQRSKWRPLITPTYNRRARDYGLTLVWNF